jgi:uncharacterized damage-inducible protein DinB
VSSVDSLHESLRSSRAGLLDAVRGLNEEQFRFSPAADGWSIAAHLAHLLRIERVYAERASAALTQDAPFVASTRVHNDDDPALAQRLAVPQMIHGLLNTRRDLEAVLSNCGLTDLQRPIRHETIGLMTIEQIMVKMSGHESEHVEEIQRLVKQAPTSARVIIPLTTRS